MRPLLILVPLCIVLGLLHVDPVWVFIACCLAILPLAGLMEEFDHALIRMRKPASQQGVVTAANSRQLSRLHGST